MGQREIRIQFGAGVGGTQEKSSQSSPWSLTAGKENIAPQPQTPHHVVPLALTPPGKVRKACASPTGFMVPLGPEGVTPVLAPVPDPFLCALNTWVLGSALTFYVILGKSLLFHGQNDGVGFFATLEAVKFWGANSIPRTFLLQPSA